MKKCVNTTCARDLADDTEVCGNCGTRQPTAQSRSARDTRGRRNQAVGDTSAQGGGIAQGGASNVQQNAPGGNIFNRSFILFGLFHRPAPTRPASPGPESEAIEDHGPRQQLASSALPPTPGMKEGKVVVPKMPERVYGPRDVFVPLNPRSNTIKSVPTGVLRRDLDAEALIHIPYSLREGKWSAGFHLRAHYHTAVYGDYVFIASDGKWHHYWYGPSERFEVASGGHYAIRTECPGTNLVRFVADEKVGALIINDALPVWLELGDLHRFIRSVDVIAGYFAGDGVMGKAVRFERLEIRTRQRKS